MNLPIDNTIIANVVKHAPNTSITIGHKVTVKWAEATGLWAVKCVNEFSELDPVAPVFTAKTISEVVTFLIEKDLLPDVAFGQVHIDNNVKVQPMPIPNSKPALWDKAKERFWNWAENNSVDPKIVDSLTKKMTDRDDYGLKKYGTRLLPFNGRNFRNDVIDEILDALVYVEGLKAEMENTPDQ
jgi:hypothetical protein